MQNKHLEIRQMLIKKLSRDSNNNNNSSSSSSRNNNNYYYKERIKTKFVSSINLLLSA